ncbi:TPA: hypothetical protein N0F65_003300 [Lagenidium giganteum]|uniref:Tf2-1-like SH3-like domain-containing protein n=1 Tax=Lagenidium giganteum TaxID=4803 RepID=A0AAV2YWU9_9STRA|nr:TPA: hypothetical protein N0F65_003300 [Lagenidium giganteum]
MQLYYDTGRRNKTFQVGEMVLISTQNLSVANLSTERRKLGPKWIWPYEVVRVEEDGTSYTLNLLEELRLHPTFHTMNLKSLHQDTSNRMQFMPAVKYKDGTKGEHVARSSGTDRPKPGEKNITYDGYMAQRRGNQLQIYSPCQGSSVNSYARRTKYRRAEVNDTDKHLNCAVIFLTRGSPWGGGVT